MVVEEYLDVTKQITARRALLDEFLEMYRDVEGSTYRRLLTYAGAAALDDHDDAMALKLKNR